MIDQYIRHDEQTHIHLGHIWDMFGTFWDHGMGAVTNLSHRSFPRPGGTPALGGSAALDGAGHGTARQGFE